ncbi:MAG: hypothetical protein HY974_01920 [Candidatus Kerfeldbacteria bacterium]|nr:hypothetical protein [Candidatus Kerfeldbacteria bacterium]
MKALLAVILGLGLVYPSAVAAVGVGVKPLSLEIAAGLGQEVVQEIQITNPSLEPGLFAVSADDLSDWFEFEPAEVRLEAHESKIVKVRLKPQGSGRLATSLSVVGYPLDTRSFKAGSGLKVPVSLVVTGSAATPWWRYLGWGLLLLTVSGSAILGFRQWRHRSLWQRLRGWWQ